MNPYKLLIPIIVFLGFFTTRAVYRPLFTHPEILKQVRCWHYQLQNYSTIHVGGFNRLLVIDPFKNTDTQTRWSNAEIQKFKKKSPLVLAYLSIGEAEKYRPYWNTFNRSLLVSENKEWSGNYLVRFWDPRWQSIFLSDQGELYHVLSAGFDGIYLDRVDACYELLDKNPKACDEMNDFLKRIRQVSKSISSDSLMIVQNAPCLPGTQIADALAVESLFLPQPLIEDIRCADAFHQSGKPVFSVEYPELSKSGESRESLIQRLSKQIREHHWIGLFANRKLDGTELRAVNCMN